MDARESVVNKCDRESSDPLVGEVQEGEWLGTRRAGTRLLSEIR